MASEDSRFRVTTVDGEDVATCVDIITRAFAGFSIQDKLGNTNDAEGREGAGQRHLRTWREHEEDTGIRPAVKCTYRHPDTHTETIVACALWFIYPQHLPRNDERGPNHLISGVWLPDDQRTKIRQTFKPALDIREKWTAGSGYGVLMYMATDPDWRRRGAATACVEWGIERCRELGIPACLEASKEGAPVYERLGFQIVDDVRMEIDGEKMEYPFMMWWPPGARPSA